jgi:hypothetical protein
MKLIIVALMLVGFVYALILIGKWLWLGFKYGWTYQDGLPDDDDE